VPVLPATGTRRRWRPSRCPPDHPRRASRSSAWPPHWRRPVPAAPGLGRSWPWESIVATAGATYRPPRWRWCCRRPASGWRSMPPPARSAQAIEVPTTCPGGDQQPGRLAREVRSVSGRTRSS
jgi:hypothetical protein